MRERIYISQAKQLLNFKDNRSLKRWCFLNGIKVLCDKGSNKKYLLLSDFEECANKEIMEYQNNRKVFVTKKHSSSPNYKPSGNHEKNFLSILQNEMSEL